MVSVPFDKNNKNLREIYDEVSANFHHEIQDINPTMLNNFILNNSKQLQRNIVYYMFNDEEGVSINFKALSGFDLFQDDTVFISLFNPPLE
jgi:hypothetical protein